MTKDDIKKLTAAIDTSVGHTGQPTRRYFNFLKDNIYNRTRETIGETTLKRLWGYIQGYSAVRSSTIEVLCHYLGYQTMEDFLNSVEDGADIPSYEFIGDFIPVERMIETQQYRLTWAPGRVCDVEYNGYRQFTVLYSELTKLVPGTTFHCSGFEKGQPVRLYDVKFPGQNKSCQYEIGKKYGINYELIPRYKSISH